MDLKLFVNGTLMRGLALHANLDGAEFLGVAVPGEIYRLPPDVWARVEAGEPPDLYKGPVHLADDRVSDP